MSTNSPSVSPRIADLRKSYERAELSEDASQADPLITLTFGLPNHPSYPSGHSCVSAAAATVLASLFPNETAALASSVTEAGLSRMYAGIHYRFDIDAGRSLGNAVAQWAIAHAYLLD